MLASILITTFTAVSTSARVFAPRATTFGSCGSPAIIFANGLDGRTEPAFEPANLVDFGHGSALNIGVISSFICQRLSDTCHASQSQIAACASGEAAAAKLTGQPAADAFNAALGVSAPSPSGATIPPVPAASTPPATATPVPTTSSTVTNTGSLSFGKCTDPTVIFGAGLDGRKATEFSFLPHDQTQFNHGSALNPDIIFQFTCDNFVNNCGLAQTDTAVTTCRSAQKTADALGKTGTAADKFNELLGFKTDFAALDAAPADQRRTLRKIRRDPRLALKEMTQEARRKGFSLARYVKVEAASEPDVST